MDLVPLPKSNGRLWKNKADFFRPFRSAAAAAAGENIEPLYEPGLAHGPEDRNVKELNEALRVLVELFPDVEVEVLREMVVNVSKESRVELVAEAMLKKRRKGTGRVRLEAEGGGKKGENADGLEKEDLFRSESYKKAVKQVFCQEFRNLSHSTIRGVLAEQNFSYTLSRPILQQVTSRSWRFSISNLWARKATDSTVAAGGHPFIVWKTNGAEPEPIVRKTGCEELDQELYEQFVEPIVARQRQERLQADFAAASEINEKQAEEAAALFDCECCFGSVPFESIATCDDGCHYLCMDCIRRTVHEALYGQGWARTADLKRSTVRCFAPTSSDCNGCIPSQLVQRSLNQGTNNQDAWQEFQARTTSETLLKSGLPLQRCPFCNYAETNELPSPKLKHPLAIWHHITTKAPPAFQILFLSLLMALSLFFVPLLCLAAISWLLCETLPAAHNPLKASITRVQASRRTLRFQCQNPTCRRVTCTRCTAPHRNGHICFEDEKTSLRTAIETSATLAIKRTCPRCLLSFIKSSGCNKLVCNCGYTMCYVCRAEIGKEGYVHFCQHFRPHGGVCGECERCDLYGDEDEESVLRRAVEGAEREWRERNDGEDGQEGSRRMIEVIVGDRKKGWWEGWVDGVVEAVLA
ncbi:E3 ubiquitin- ligase RNF216-like [Lecanosticta acicola]|uniref:E3 ubiquitin- ligase RNF216-like n=1 Tax=Lecanosticta acicola TaxID=111012 RepID=A0AAI9EC04_9PEZI|nr:E3 ubiquitin- ligase RNF216-like [Lecanosticta acicola]